MVAERFKTRAYYPIAAVGLAMVGFILIKTGRDALFFRSDSLEQLPLAYIWIAMASVPAAMIHLQVMDRWGARRARTAVFFVSAVFLLGLTPWIEAESQLVLTGLFVLVPTLFGALFAGAWLLAGDLLEGAAAETLRWVYARIGAASMLGGIGGGLAAKGLAMVGPPRLLVVCGALVLFGAGGVVVWAHRRYPAHEASPAVTEPTPSESMLGLLAHHAGLFKNRYIAFIAGIGALMALAGLAIEFQFYAAAVAAGRNNSQFFANFYIAINAVSLVLQLFVAPLLQKRFGIGGALLVLPGVLLGGAGLFAWGAAAQAQTLLKVTEGGLKASIHRSSWEQAFLPIPRQSRGAVKSMVDGLLARLAEGLGATLLYLWILYHNAQGGASLNLQWLAGGIGGVLVLWLVSTLYLRKIGPEGTSSAVVVPLPDG